MTKEDKKFAEKFNEMLKSDVLSGMTTITQDYTNRLFDDISSQYNVDIIDVLLKIDDIYIPDGITDIEDDAFSSCIGLVTLRLPQKFLNMKDLTGIRKRCFATSLFLLTLTVGDEVFDLA